MKKYFLYLFLPLLTFSCNNSDLLTEDHEVSLRSSSIKYSLFKNIEADTDDVGNAFIEGEIYCSETATATINFAYQGSPASTYEFRTPTGLIIPGNGSSIRSVTTTLRPGINKFTLCVLFSSPGESAYARAALVSIGGDRSLNGEGYIDLSVDGYSRLVDVGGTPFHSICSKCGFSNSQGAPRCLACGK